MSSLNSFTILEKGNDFVDIKVSIIHPDEHLVQSSANFALQIILELYENIQKGYIYNSNWSFYPFSEAESLALIDKNYENELDELVQKMRWRQIPISKKEHDQISASGEFVYKGQKLSSLGMENGAYYAALETEYDAFCQEADKKIRLVEVLGVKNYPHWFDRLECWLEHENLSYGFDDEVYDLHEDEADPEYLLRIHVAEDAAFLLNHIVAGCFWESAAFNYNYYCKTFKDHKNAHHNCLIYDTESSDATDEDLIKWWNSLSMDWKKVFNINYFLQSREYYPTLHEQFKGMMTFGVFERHYGKEKMLELFDKNPSPEEIRMIVSMKILLASNCDLKDLSPLIELKNLKVLELESNPVENTEVLQFLTNLEDLTLIVNGDKPNQLTIGNLTKIKDLTLDPRNQEEFDLLKNMPSLRSFYTVLDFEPDLSVFKDFLYLKKVVGYSPTLNAASVEILEHIRSSGVDVNWETDTFSV
jgi:hypothetical protein